MKKEKTLAKDTDITAMTPNITISQDEWNYKTNKLHASNEMLQNIANTYHSCLTLKEHTKQLEIITDYKLKALALKYSETQNMMNKIFAERGTGLNKHYEVLDYAIKNNDRESIIATLNSISTIITKSPLEELTEFSKIWDDPTQNIFDF